MKKSYKIILISTTLFIMLIFGGALYCKYFINGASNECNVKKEEKTISWDSMYPMLSNGEKVLFLNDYYNVCTWSINKWDIIEYKFAGSDVPLIKILKINSLDNVEIVWNNLKVNWELMKNSIWQEYSFSNWEINLIKLFVTNWKIPDWSYMIFWDNVNNSIDSRKFWAISASDILGKFEIIKK